MSNSIEVSRCTDGFALAPSSYDEAMKICQMLAKSDLVPTAYKGKPENVFVAMSWGREIGLKGLQAVQNIAVIGNRPAIWGDAALAIVMAHPDFEDVSEAIEGDGDSMIATCTIKRRGRAPVTRQFTVAEAKKAGLWAKSGPWTQYPRRMLQMRARGFALRDAFPDALRGLSIAEEAQDIEERDITPKDERPAVVMPRASRPAAQQEPVKAAEVVDTETGEVLSADVEPTQGLEELTHPKGETYPPQQDEPTHPAPVEGVATLSDGQLKLIRAKLAAAGLYEVDLCKAFQVQRLEAVASADANAALAWIKARVA